jgi:hypothetical protein
VWIYTQSNIILYSPEYITPKHTQK